MTTFIFVFIIFIHCIFYHFKFHSLKFISNPNSNGLSYQLLSFFFNCFFFAFVLENEKIDYNVLKFDYHCFVLSLYSMLLCLDHLNLHLIFLLFIFTEYHLSIFKAIDFVKNNYYTLKSFTFVFLSFLFSKKLISYVLAS